MNLRITLVLPAVLPLPPSRRGQDWEVWLRTRPHARDGLYPSSPDHPEEGSDRERRTPAGEQRVGVARSGLTDVTGLQVTVTGWWGGGHWLMVAGWSGGGH